MFRISHLFFWLPHIRNKTPMMQVVFHIMVSIGVIGMAVGVIFFIRRSIDHRVAIARERLLFLDATEQRETVPINLNNDYNRLAPLLPVLYSILPRPEDAIAFADAVQIVAKETGNMISFQFETNEPSPDSMFSTVGQVRFNAKIEGTGGSFSRFLQRLQTSRYISTIDTIDIQGPSGIYGAVTVLIKGTLFIQKSPL